MTARLAPFVLLLTLGQVAADLPGQSKSEKGDPRAVDPPVTSKRPKNSPSAPRLFDRDELPVADPAPLAVEAANARAVTALLALPEGDGDQWPYEGVYREDRGQLPVGYRVGGTAIVCLGLIAAPGYERDTERQSAVERGVAFVLKTLEVERMTIGFEGRYDVRNWGKIYALQLFLHLQDQGLVPAAHADGVRSKTTFLVQSLVESAIPESGGWNYSRRAGFLSPKNRASTFMTPAALQALFHAEARGHEVPKHVVDQALDALERARSQAGGYAYGAGPGNRNEVPEEKLSMMDKTPGAAARAALCETTLKLAGRGDDARLERAVQSFFDNWDELAVRKSQRGTHVRPYGIAPYYFMFGHVYAAQAIEQIEDQRLRDELRDRMRVVLARSIEPDGSWNDRQFPRSAGYGTAMAILTLNMPELPKPEPWRGGAVIR